jgi:hypothetical protein
MAKNNFFLAVPLLSLGGIGAALLLQAAGIIGDAGTWGWGCVAGSFVLGYRAYILPRRDIVALCVPLFAILIFVVPMDFTPNLLLQALYAASITFLAARLELKFGSVRYRPGSDPMERFLSDYIERMKPQYTHIGAGTAHELASAFLAFKYGLYANTVRECTHALTLLVDQPGDAPLKKALQIAKANAESLDASRVETGITVSFSESERAFAPVNLPPEAVEDPATLELDNALTLIYVVALTRSPDDEEAMEEHRKFIIRLLSGYRKALGLG